ncbi:hypothetical protein AB1Y20_004623 [Prymnesium parvum]|uniref:Probable threonine--tRNA ligase, cytoplasmic n=1 Tax=Prymnesium parvum TaxID=97485 RepID=A0AB34IZL9_PRYPA
MDPAFFENPAALAKLAKLNPLSEQLAAPSATHSRKEGKRLTEGGGKSIEGATRIGGAFEPTADPPWLAERSAALDAIVARAAARLEAARQPIRVTLPDGSVKDATAFETTPAHIAEAISKGLLNATCVASVRYSRRLEAAASAVVNTDAMEEAAEEGPSEWELWDVGRPLEGDCELQLHKFDDDKGKEVFWHSSAHILGEALETLYGVKLTHGPATSTGFFYDSYMGKTPVTPEMTAAVEKKVKQLVAAKAPFERVVVSKEEAAALFKDNPFKQAIISSKLPDGAMTTVYRSGKFVDLCRGPHLPNTSRVKAFAVTKTSASQWLGKQGNDELQRVYGITFPDKKDLAEWTALQEEAAKRDHRKIGVDQQLLFFDDLSPGSCFFLPHGCRLYNKLMEIIREQYWKRGYSEVVTPNMYNLKLWETSGHAAKYKENMFCFDIEAQEFGLKPMNCPGHCIMFKSRKRSYRELPMRYADFGVLHRNELSGALTGLTRVRRFQQDDAHIFCTVAQIKEEVAGVLDMIATVYSFFGMKFALKLSTRPENALGDVEVWDRAESLMTEALNEFKAKTGQGWTLNPGDGAFYGPKIDVQVFDALKRAFQCATVQLDFVQPMRFDLKYQSGDTEGSGDKFERPVMVHRAVLGSVERMIAILIEHYAGKWPFFLSPRQVMVVPVSKTFTDYALKVRDEIHAAGFYVDVELSQRTLNKMVRETQLAQYNFILVVGAKEEETSTVTIRTRDNEVRAEPVSVADLIAEFKQLVVEHK